MSVHFFPSTPKAELGLAEAGRHLRTAFIILRAGTGQAMRRMRTRRRLVELEPHMLRDIGITRLDAEFEANKPFWVA